MHACLLNLLLCVTAAPPTGTLLRYEGEIVADREEAVRKEVRYEVLVAETGEKSTRLLWAVAEKGQGSWPWIEQFGKLVIDPTGKHLDGKPASVLFGHADGLSPVPLAPAVFAGPKPLADAASWRVDRLQFDVSQPDDAQTVGKSWQVNVATAIGRNRTVLVSKDESLVTDVDEIVFMGPGKKHRLTLALVNRKQLDADALAQAVASFEALCALKDDLSYETQGGRIQWDETQLAKLKSQLPMILEQASGTFVEELTLRAGGDVKLQKGIAAATARLRDEFIGQPAPLLSLKSASLSGTDLSIAKARGKPLVLHIWSYRDNPLVEPYGQIGYLDFLYRRHKADGVQVFGIAVDDRLDRPDTRSDAVRSVRKMKAFMNVGYPIVLGGRNVLEQLGDPARFGAELPLVVVIGSDGKIADYHLGLYEVDRDHGLVELDAAVEKLK